MKPLIIQLNAKCDDRCNIVVVDEGEVIVNRSDYVPRNMGLGGGDYIELMINTETGQIVNWPRLGYADMSQEEFIEFMTRS